MAEIIDILNIDQIKMIPIDSILLIDRVENIVPMSRQPASRRLVAMSPTLPVIS